MTGNSARLRVALICVKPAGNANTIHDHIGAFQRWSRHSVDVVDNLSARFGSFGGRVSAVPECLQLDRYDVLVLHYSNYLLSNQHFDKVSRERIRTFRGLKVLFLQDEYRRVDAFVKVIAELGIHVLFTCVPEPEWEKVYPRKKLPGLRLVNNLTGYVPDALLTMRVPPIADRPIDVGYRARKVPFVLGELAAEKWQIVPRFEAACAGSGLTLDLSYREEDRIYGTRWPRFVSSCKTVLSVESGASVFDFTGELEEQVEAYVHQHPDAEFEEVQRLFLREHEGRVRLNQISPRCFEAAALRTAMVQFEGEYSGILKPWRHYVPLRKDFSNIEEVVAAIRDPRKLQEIADRCFEEVACDPRNSYRHFIAGFDDVVEAERAARGLERVGTPPAIGPRMILHSLKAFVATMSWAWHNLPQGFRDWLRPHMRRSSGTGA